MDQYKEWEARWAEQQRRERELVAANQKAVFEALAALGIERVLISFDSYGDSGQIDNVAITGGAGQLSGDVTVTAGSIDGHPEPLTLPLERAVEDLCYALLGCEHCGWQDNDGSFGEFDFKAAERSIELEFNQRYTDHETSTHTFAEA